MDTRDRVLSRIFRVAGARDPADENTEREVEEAWRNKSAVRFLERLASQRFDLLVVGAGIIGSRIAYDAARAGMSVALIDAGDFGCATSSASSKLRSRTGARSSPTRSSFPGSTRRGRRFPTCAQRS